MVTQSSSWLKKTAYLNRFNNARRYLFLTGLKAFGLVRIDRKHFSTFSRNSPPSPGFCCSYQSKASCMSCTASGRMAKFSTMAAQDPFFRLFPRQAHLRIFFEFFLAPLEFLKL